MQWRGVLHRRVVSWRESETDSFYRIEPTTTDDSATGQGDGDFDAVVRDYLHAHLPLQPLVSAWSAADRRFAQIVPFFPGCRLLRQDPVECLFSFLCSSNNNIPRITQSTFFFSQLISRGCWCT